MTAASSVSRRRSTPRSTWRAKPIKRDGGLSGVSTGIHALDMRMGGLQTSDLIVLAGRPGMGKTSLATNIAFNIAHAYEPGAAGRRHVKARRTAASSASSRLEMSSEQLATRIISEQTEISSSKIRRGEITEPDFEKLVACAQMMQKHAALYRPDRRHFHRAACGARAAAEAAARPRRAGHRLYPADAGIESKHRTTACRK